MQCRITSYVPPKQIWFSQCRIQYELSTDRLPEYDSTIGAGWVTALNKWQQLFTQELLKLAGSAPVISLRRLRRVVGTAIISTVEIIASVRNANNNRVWNFFSQSQVTVIRRQEWKQRAAVQKINRRLSVIGGLIVSIRQHHVDVVATPNAV